MRQTPIWIAIAIALGTGYADRAWAQPNGGSAQTKSAVSLAKEAKERYDRGDWAGALGLFQAAEAEAHSPVLVLYMARCHRNMGRLTRAQTLYQSVVSASLSPDAPAPFAAAQRDAESDLEILSARIPSVQIDVSKLEKVDAVTIDGTRHSIEDLAKPIALDPGEHAAVAFAGQSEIARVAFRLEEGNQIAVSLEPAVIEPRPSAPSQPAPPIADSPDGSISPVPGWILVGVGAVGLGVGVGTRVMAFSKVDEVKSRCTEQGCLVEDQTEIESAETLQTVSTISLIAGGVAAGAGIVMLVLAADDGGQNVTLKLNPTWVGLSGSF